MFLGPTQVLIQWLWVRESAFLAGPLQGCCWSRDYISEPLVLTQEEMNSVIYRPGVRSWLHSLAMTLGSKSLKLLVFQLPQPYEGQSCCFLTSLALATSVLSHALVKARLNIYPQSKSSVGFIKVEG